jgi:hypothetical protein
MGSFAGGTKNGLGGCGRETAYWRGHDGCWRGAVDCAAGALEILDFPDWD